jgi:hypothetical protein
VPTVRSKVEGLRFDIGPLQRSPFYCVFGHLRIRGGLRLLRDGLDSLWTVDGFGSAGHIGKSMQQQTRVLACFTGPSRMGI